jgi:hypothetical protein
MSWRVAELRLRKMLIPVLTSGNPEAAAGVFAAALGLSARL